MKLINDFTLQDERLNKEDAVLNLLAIIIPCCYISIKQYQKGILGRPQFTTNSQTNNKKSSFKKRTFFASLGFGFFMTSFQFLGGTHSFLSLLKYFLITSITWGVLFYLLMSLLLKFSKKRNTKLDSTNEE
ncbi:MAG: hypothetical protein ACRDAU_16640 [Clostridium sp.]